MDELDEFMKKQEDAGILSGWTQFMKEEEKPNAIKPICKIIFDVPYYFCGNCKTMLNMYSTKAKFCSQCGQAVQWG